MTTSATCIHVCLFEGEKETHRIALTKQGDFHTGFIPGLVPGARYGLRAEGPPPCDPSKLLVDPMATRLDRPYTYHPDLAKPSVDTAHLVPKAVVETAHVPLHQQTRQPQWIYELPVKAFSKRNPAIPEQLRGTVAALAHPASLAHFNRLRCDTIELMPLAAWIDERHLHAAGLHNAWGYNPVTFMAPDPRLAPRGFKEIADTVRVLHREGYQVILDVVLNHTGEGDAGGPTLSFRGLDNTSYYAHANGQLINDAGTGNTVALNHPHVSSYVVQALRHWVEATGIDGFRFDLATIMGREPKGFNASAPFLSAINADPVLSSRILIAEPWDIGPGGYQLGNFPAGWHEWNDRYRDDVRRFWRGDDFSANNLATRIAGSSDVFARKSPSHSINFISAHDGFTLADLTRYAHKNNFANGEDNRDGKNNEVTCLEVDPRALLATLFLSRGTPMLTAGDEFGRSQHGNNNAYAQDNDLTWLDWNNADQDLIDFTAALVDLRKQHPALTSDTFLNAAEATWIDVDGRPLNWHQPNNPVVGLHLNNVGLTLVFNRSISTVSLRTAPRP